jgi:hypothetical protein
MYSKNVMSIRDKLYSRILTFVHTPLSSPARESPPPGRKYGGRVAPVGQVGQAWGEVARPFALDERLAYPSGTHECRVEGCTDLRTCKQLVCSYHEKLRRFYNLQYNITKPRVTEILEATDADAHKQLTREETDTVLDHLYWRGGLDALLGDAVDARHAHFTERVKQLLPPAVQQKFQMRLRE